ncbi:hypothetical protein KIN20_007806 [Parelaphostrongylus tenuis]|uniref:Uncharacterized protein n=1 Tax=Parelaphostrongylus tenuis TaxID=148309 RepID=A0AAD5MPK7_PARTN|nr:hypothetical protein KIN20_007668 [Parelaphostrongylus tenuis]KAJ1351691.1 hypothetical protein KIN20_007806 [Parelaphostrongylus tenuis]
MESLSKFACLHIEDDSDADEASTTIVAKNSRSSFSGSKRVKSGGKPIVHAVEKRRQRGRANKEKDDQNMPPSGLVLRSIGGESRGHNSPSLSCEKMSSAEGIEIFERRFAEEHKEIAAVEQETMFDDADLENYEPRFRDAEVSEKAEPVIDLDESRSAVAELSAQLAAAQTEVEQYKSKLKSLGALISSPGGIEFYKIKLSEVYEEMAATIQEMESKNAVLEKYQSRFQKLIELFEDDEISEKAELVIELNKRRAAVDELSAQLAAVEKELEEHKSKLRSLGALDG